MNSLNIGSRGSELALAQTEMIATAIRGLNPSVKVAIKPIKTTGDKLTTASLVTLASETKGLFVKEIEEALLNGSIDLAVHSLKDVPTELPSGLALGIIPLREDPRDALISPHPIRSLSDLRQNARIGTSSLRRRLQLESARSDLEIVPLRGNVGTRIRKLTEENLDAIVLAAAGLKRLGRSAEISYRFPVSEMVPAIGQGCLAIEVRENDASVLSLIQGLDHPPTRACCFAERHFLHALGGGCQVPIGAHAEFLEEESLFSLFIASPRGGCTLRHRLKGKAEEVQTLACRAVEYVKANGAERILKETYNGS